MVGAACAYIRIVLSRERIELVLDVKKQMITFLPRILSRPNIPTILTRLGACNASPWSLFGTTSSSAMEAHLPVFAKGEVIRGFGRGSKELGIPTANFPDDVVDGLPKEIETGIFFGWAKVDASPIHPMVVSIGWNPYYNNTKKTIETHILHEFAEDFYGCQMKIVITGFIRPEQSYDSLDALIEAIHNDINVAKTSLHGDSHQTLKDHEFFKGA